MGKYSSLFLLSIISFSLSFKCGYNEIKKPELKILNESKNIDSNTRNLESKRNINIYIDYEVLEFQVLSEEITEDYYKNLAKALNSTVNYFSKLLMVQGPKVIYLEGYLFSSIDYIKRAEVPNIIFKYIDADLILIPKVYYMGSNIDAAAYPIALNNYDYRPICGGILLGFHYDFSQLNAQRYLIMLLLHEITHILGFSNYLYDYFQTPYNLTTNKTVNEINRTLFTGPNVIKQAKRHFNCNDIEGIELENQGGDGSVGSHWEARIMLGDYMISTDYGEIVISEISLALLEDSGWYTVNYYTGGLFRYGKGLGCDFLNNKCVSDNITSFKREFCVKNEERCFAGNIDRGYCYLSYYNDIPSEYQYFNSSEYGGFFPADYCPVTMSYSYYYYYYFYSKCDLYGYNYNRLTPEYGEIYGDKSICVLSSLKPLSSISDDFMTARCHKVISCNPDKTFSLDIGNVILNCSGNYEEVEVEGYYGTIICPDYNRVCTGSVWCNDPLICIEKESLYLEENNIKENIFEENNSYVNVDVLFENRIKINIFIYIFIILILF